MWKIPDIIFSAKISELYVPRLLNDDTRVAQTSYQECSNSTFFESSNYIEKGQTISGRIKGFFGGNVKKGPICVLAPKQKIVATTTTDEKGEFIVNTSFKDSTTSSYRHAPKGDLPE